MLKNILKTLGCILILSASLSVFAANKADLELSNLIQGNWMSTAVIADEINGSGNIATIFEHYNFNTNKILQVTHDIEGIDRLVQYINLIESIAKRMDDADKMKSFILEEVKEMKDYIALYKQIKAKGKQIYIKSNWKVANGKLYVTDFEQTAELNALAPIDGSTFVYAIKVINKNHIQLIDNQFAKYGYVDVTDLYRK